MARTAWLNVGLLLLALLVLDTSVERTSFAGEAAAKSAQKSEQKSEHATPPDGKDRAPADSKKGGGGDHAAGEGAGAQQPGPTGSRPEESTGRDHAPIDTSITVEPYRPAAKKEVGKDLKTGLRSFNFGNQQLRRATSPPRSVTRNAIGVVVAPRPEPGHRDSNAVPFVAHSPAGPITGVGTGAVAAIPKPAVIPETSRLPHPTLAPPAAALASVHPGAINGTVLTHQGAGPAKIGGPAKTLAGINGTTVKGKR